MSSPRGNSLPRFLASRSRASAVGAELRAKLENHLKFQWSTGGAKQPLAVSPG